MSKPAFRVYFWLIWGAVVALFAWLILIPAAARAQSQHCNARDVVIERLADGWGEGRVAMGLAINGTLMEAFANLQTGSWTLVVTTPGGLTCLVAAGTDFQLVTAPEGEES